MSVRNKSNTFDEVVHLTAGYTYWRFNDYRFHPENGNLPQRWVSLPLILNPKNFPEIVHNVWDAGHDFFFKCENDADAMLFHGRFMAMMLSAALGLAVFFISRKLFGPLGGAISLILYTFSPTVLAHGRLTTSDMAVALFFIVSVWSLWCMLHRMTICSLAGSSLTGCCLLLSKMSGVLLVLVYGLLLITRLIEGRPLFVKIIKEKRIVDRRAQLPWILTASLIVTMVCFSGIWSAYGFRFEAAKQSSFENGYSFSSWEENLSNMDFSGEVIRYMRDEKWLPEAYLYGLAHVLCNAQHRSAFMNGRYSNHGWWYFFPFCFWVKTPLLVLFLCVLSTIAFMVFRKPNDLYNMCPLLILGAVYLLAALMTRMNIGQRHILVLYPVIFIFLGVLSRVYERASLVFFLIAPIFLLVYILETQSVYPHYLAFFNNLAGGPDKGYRKLVDSSLDWGQDLPGLRKWIKDNQSESKEKWPVYFAYFGTASPIYHRIDANIIFVHPFPWTKDINERSLSLRPGYYCISATALQQVYGIQGQWTDIHEKQYRLLREKVESLIGDEKGVAQQIEGGKSNRMREILEQFECLRFARLCTYLRGREPDENVGCSILIYFLPPSELNLALNMPIPVKGK